MEVHARSVRDTRRKRAGGAAARRQARLNAPIAFPSATRRNIPTYDVLHIDGLEAVDDHALKILETTGI